MFSSFSELILWSNIIGFTISFILNLAYNSIQRRDSREPVSFGSIMGWGVFLSIILFIIFFLKELGL